MWPVGGIMMNSKVLRREVVVIVLTTYADAKDAFRQRDLRQALYDDGEHLMGGVIVNLHGTEHLDRRRLEIGRAHV